MSSVSMLFRQPRFQAVTRHYRALNITHVNCSVARSELMAISMLASRTTSYLPHHQSVALLQAPINANGRIGFAGLHKEALTDTLCGCRDYSRCGLSQWDKALQCNAFSNWLSPYPSWSLCVLLFALMWYSVLISKHYTGCCRGLCLHVIW